jgi:hypothetical protein
MNREEIPTKAEEYICKDRNTSYGEPEDSFLTIANLWNDYMEARPLLRGIAKLSAVDVGIMMTLLKVARMASGNKEDNYIDAAGYIACAGEIATKANAEKFCRTCVGCEKEPSQGDFGCKNWTQSKSKDNPLSIYSDGEKSYIQPNTDEREKFWHDVLTSNGDVD